MSVEDGSNVRREEKRQMTSSIANTKWNASSGQYVVDVSKVGGELASVSFYIITLGMASKDANNYVLTFLGRLIFLRIIVCE